MSTTYDDALGAIVAWLQTTGTDLYSACGTNIWKDRAQAGFDNTYAAVVCIDAGGGERLNSPIEEWTMQCRCYGGSSNPDAATQVYSALRDVLKGASSVVLGNIRLMIVDVENRTKAIETDAGQSPGWPVVNAFFRVTNTYTA
jgi:hypothetical protein